MYLGQQKAIVTWKWFLPVQLSTKYEFELLFQSGNVQTTIKLQGDGNCIKKYWLIKEKKIPLKRIFSNATNSNIFCPPIVLKNTSKSKTIFDMYEWLK